MNEVADFAHAIPWSQRSMRSHLTALFRAVGPARGYRQKHSSGRWPIARTPASLSTDMCQRIMAHARLAQDHLAHQVRLSVTHIPSLKEFFRRGKPTDVGVPSGLLRGAARRNHMPYSWMHMALTLNAKDISQPLLRS